MGVALANNCFSIQLRRYQTAGTLQQKGKEYKGRGTCLRTCRSWDENKGEQPTRLLAGFQSPQESLKYCQ